MLCSHMSDAQSHSQSLLRFYSTSGIGVGIHVLTNQLVCFS